MRKYLYLIYLFLVSTLLTGCGAEQAMKKGDKFYALGEYFDAATQYKKAYTQTPAKERALRGQRALKLAECYRRINYTQKAIAAYNNVLRYKQGDTLTTYRLAHELMKNGNYKEAEKYFQQVRLPVGTHRTTVGPAGSQMATGRVGIYREARELLQLAAQRLFAHAGRRERRHAVLHVDTQPGQR